MCIWVLIPAYNERLNLGNILSNLKDKGLFTLVVDDGSTDGTYSVAKDKSDLVIQNKANLGKGRSLKKAIEYLLKNRDFDYIITMDADRQHSHLDLEYFLKEAQKQSPFVIGNRMNDHQGMPKIRVYTNKLMSWFISKIVKQKIPDTQCGFRLIKREVLEKITIKTSNFEIESEIIIKAARGGFKIKSIPIRSIYFKDNRSKIHPFIDTLRFMKFITKVKDEKR